MSHPGQATSSPRRIELRLSTALLLVSLIMWGAGFGLAYLSKWYLTESRYVDVAVVFLLGAPVFTSALAGIAAIGFFVFWKRTQFLVELVASTVLFFTLWLTFGGR